MALHLKELDHIVDPNVIYSSHQLMERKSIFGQEGRATYINLMVSRSQEANKWQEMQLQATSSSDTPLPWTNTNEHKSKQSL